MKNYQIAYWKTLKNNLICILTILCLVIFSQMIFSHQVLAQEDFDLIWEAKTYTPPLYSGKPLATQGSEITVTVVPLSDDLKQKGYIYNWSLATEPQGSRFQREKSGPNKLSFTFVTKSRYLTTEVVDLEVLDSNQNFVFSRSLEIPIRQVEAKIYQSDEQKNMFYLRASSLQAALNFNEEKSYYFLIIPFFFNIESRKELDYAWNIDNQLVEQSNFLDLKVLKEKKNFNIIKTISAQILNLTKRYENAESNFLLVIK